MSGSTHSYPFPKERALPFLLFSSSRYNGFPRDVRMPFGCPSHQELRLLFLRNDRGDGFELSFGGACPSPPPAVGHPLVRPGCSSVPPSCRWRLCISRTERRDGSGQGSAQAAISFPSQHHSGGLSAHSLPGLPCEHLVEEKPETQCEPPCMQCPPVSPRSPLAIHYKFLAESSHWLMWQWVVSHYKQMLRSCFFRKVPVSLHISG